MEEKQTTHRHHGRKRNTEHDFDLGKNLSKQLIQHKIEMHCEGIVEAFTDD